MLTATVFTILESITDGFLALDREWRFIYVNGAAERMLGSTRQELVGKNHWETYPATLGTIGERSYRRAIQEQVPVEFELFYETWAQWFSITAYPTADGGLSVFFRNTTEEKMLFEEQCRQRRTLETVLSSTPDHAYILDLEGRFLYANRAVLEMWQMPLEKLARLRLSDLKLPADVSETLRRNVQEVVVTGRSLRNEVEFLDLKGEECFYEYIFTPIFSETGQVEAVAGSSRDIEVRKRSERKLVEQSRLNALGAAVGVALTQQDQLRPALQQCAEAMVHHLDVAFARIWTLASGDTVLQLQSSAGLYTHLDGPHARIPVGEFKIGLIAEERRPHLTNDIAHDPRLGDRAWAEREGMVAFAGYPMIIEDRLVGVLALFAKRRLAQDTLDALASVANTIAIGIERKRAEEILEQQAEQLARSNADLQQFAYITSHDLQEPLRSMSNFSQIMLRRYTKVLDDEAQEFLSFIISGAQRMKELVDSLLTYSRVVNVETMPFAAVDLGAALNWATMNLQILIAESESRITSGTLPTVEADRVQLVQLLQNLIGNAIKYRKPGREVNIHIACEEVESEWIISVQDDGMGIRPEHTEQIFGVFKRLHGREIPGTGIGLAICKRIVEKHGGRIWVASTEGVGSTFSFTLPRQKF